MIYYFSGTGNSQWVAEQLAAQTNDQAVNLASLIEKKVLVSPITVEPNDRIGLVFPIYAWGAPKIVDEFVAGVTVDPQAYAFAVCTCGDDAGRALETLRKHFPWKAAWSISMPNNYLPMYDVDPAELVTAKVTAARKKLVEIAAHIQAGDSVKDIHHGGLAGIKTGIINPMFKTFASSTKPFTVDDTCNGCGLCARNCPRKAITMTDGKPVWTRKYCIQCMACINRCPQKAIQYGEGTRVKGRYFFAE